MIPILNRDFFIKSLNDSNTYINNILNTFYNTDKEKQDIKRNVDHIEYMLSRPDVKSYLLDTEIESYRDTIHRALVVLENG